MEPRLEIETLTNTNHLIIPKENIYKQEDMKKHTSFKIGGPAEYYIKIKTEEELKEILRLTKQNKIPLTILGNGSNLLVSDEGIKGIVAQIDLRKLEIEEEKEKRIVTVGAGEKLAQIAQTFLKEEIAGFEELSGIPGTIGGAIYMNAGAHGKEIKDLVKSIQVMDLEGMVSIFTPEEAQFEYRRSCFMEKRWIILAATLELQKGKREEIQEKMNRYQAYRREKQPIEYPSAGSSFKRGKDFVTAALIDQAGLKGYSIGGAQISQKHAGFIINKGNATAQDVLDLAEYTKKVIQEKFHQEIELEIQVIKNPDSQIGKEEK